MSDRVRKSDLLMNEVIDTRNRLRELQSEYNDYISDLAMMTKKELVKTVKELSNGTAISEIKNHADVVFENIENILFDLEEVQVGIDDIIRDMDGWEVRFQTHDKVLEVLRDQKETSDSMRRDLEALRNGLYAAYKSENPKSDLEDINKNLEDYLLSFSRLQDYVHESIPRLNKLFDEMDKDLQVSMKYGKEGLL